MSKRKPMPETYYRTSRLFRLLGNPNVYFLVKTIGKRKLRPEELAKELGRSKSTISRYLRALKAEDVVRYDTFGKKGKGFYSLYWIKDESILKVLKEGENFVEKMRMKKF